LKVFSAPAKAKELVLFLAEESSLELQIACMTFLNALVSAEGHDLDQEKSEMREALIMAEITNYIKVCYFW